MLLERIVGHAHLTYEALSTVFIQIEAAHLLIGEVLTSIPQADVTEVNENRLTHFKRLQQMVQHFWQRWSNQYVSTLQERSKWNKSVPNLEVGTFSSCYRRKSSSIVLEARASGGSFSGKGPHSARCKCKNN